VYYFKKVEDGVIISVEAKSVNVASPDFIEATKQEYDDFLASLPEPEPPMPCPEFEHSNPAHDPPTRILHIEEFLEELTTFCKAKFS